MAQPVLDDLMREMCMFTADELANGTPESLLRMGARQLGIIEATTNSEAMQNASPAMCHAFRVSIRSVIAGLDFLEAVEAAGTIALSRASRARISELREQAEDLDDTLAWGQEADALRPLVEEACK